MIKVNGKFGISATVVCDSISEAGVRLTTFEIEYPRLILAELNTHRMLSKNSASSRAIPFEKMKQQLTGRPVRWGAANKGMQDAGDCDNAMEGLYNAEEWWRLAQLSATKFSEGLHDAGYAKQVYNRLTEPFQMMKTVISGTEWDNFFHLRNDSAADPTLQNLASCMQEAMSQSNPQELKAGMWYLPYLTQDFADFGYGVKQLFFLDEKYSLCDALKIEDAIKVSCARCAAVSFRNTDYNLEKSLQVYDRLLNGGKIHGSALEHCATPMEEPQATYANLNDGSVWQEGVSHMDQNGAMWSGNYKGWIQYRKTIPGENYTAH